MQNLIKKIFKEGGIRVINEFAKGIRGIADNALSSLSVMIAWVIAFIHYSKQQNCQNKTKLSLSSETMHKSTKKC